MTIASLCRSQVSLTLAVVLAAALNACKNSPAMPVVVGPESINPFTDETVTLVGAGDIGDCMMTGPYETATLLDGMPGTIFTAGDNVQGIGSGGEDPKLFCAILGATPRSD